MKARNKTTGEIVDIEDMSIVTYKESDGTYVKTLIKNFTFIDAEKDYYTKLEHQYAGMAMQGILSNPEYLRSLMHTKHDDYRVHEVVPNVAVRLSHALVEELKGKEGK